MFICIHVTPIELCLAMGSSYPEGGAWKSEYWYSHIALNVSSNIKKNLFNLNIYCIINLFL